MSLALRKRLLKDTVQDSIEVTKLTTKHILYSTQVYIREIRTIHSLVRQTQHSLIKRTKQSLS